MTWVAVSSIRIQHGGLGSVATAPSRPFRGPQTPAFHFQAPHSFPQPYHGIDTDGTCEIRKLDLLEARRTNRPARSAAAMVLKSVSESLRSE